ncbi:MAG: PIN domain-containing protein [Candidatus Sericytochromatia bacterium]|nr:PIN domain-containing protein [Candidatus Tanganyikabacteria bacterium]
MTCVLDASAFLAYLFEERGAQMVTLALRDGALMSAVNFSEVMAKVADRGGDVDDSRQALADRGLLGEFLRVVPFDQDQAIRAARLIAALK